MKLAPKDLCSGCAACFDACGSAAISMVADGEGFLYPEIDLSKCVNCGHCSAICPVLHPDNSRQPLAVYAARAKDIELRLASSSGGMFSLLARQILSQGGRVYGAAFDRTDWSVEHRSFCDETGLDELRGSKYLQSRTAGVYRKVRSDLESGYQVLFSGTPCQIAALRHYLGRDWDGLYLVDIICHGVPSPLVWKKYLGFRTDASAGGHCSALSEGRIIKRIAFRRKDCGWKRYTLSLRFANGKVYRADWSTDSFLRGFLSELYNRPSCHNCQCRELRSGSDLTIADYWGIAEKFPDMDDDKGVSVVLVNSERGFVAFDGIRTYCDVVESDYDDIRKHNHSVYESSPASPKRKTFFKQLHKGRGFDVIIVKMLDRPLWRKIASSCRRRLLRMPLFRNFISCLAC